MTNEEKLKKLADAGEMLWTVVANVSGGDWTQQSQKWQDAAVRYRDNFWEIMNELDLLDRDEEVEEVS